MARAVKAGRAPQRRVFAAEVNASVRCGDFGSKLCYLARLPHGPVAGREWIAIPGLVAEDLELAFGCRPLAFQVADHRSDGRVSSLLIHPCRVQAANPD